MHINIDIRDQQTRNNLHDGQYISFQLNVPNAKPFDYDKFLNTCYVIPKKTRSLIDLHKNKNNNDNNKDLNYLDSSSEDDYNAIFHSTFVENNMSINGLGLLYENEVVLKSSYIKILYDYPCKTNATFHIKADNEVVGFTYGELALKSMQFFHMLYTLYKQYDLSSGCIVQSGDINNRCFDSIFEYEWRDNGLDRLIYNKQNDEWVFECIDYI